MFGMVPHMNAVVCGYSDKYYHSNMDTVSCNNTFIHWLVLRDRRIWWIFKYSEYNTKIKSIIQCNIRGQKCGILHVHHKTQNTKHKHKNLKLYSIQQIVQNWVKTCDSAVTRSTGTEEGIANCPAEDRAPLMARMEARGRENDKWQRSHPMSISSRLLWLCILGLCILHLWWACRLQALLGEEASNLKERYVIRNEQEQCQRRDLIQLWRVMHSSVIVMFRKVTYMYKERHDQMLADYIQCHWEQLAEN